MWRGLRLATLRTPSRAEPGQLPRRQFMKVTLDAAHVYRVDGVIKPGFSEIKEAMGIGKNDFYTDSGREEGVALHKWLYFLANGKTTTKKPDPRIEGRVEGIRKFLRESKFRIVGGETPLYNPQLDYCTTPDLWGFLNGRAVVIDAKRGAKERWHGMQTAAQMMALRVNKFAAIGRFGLYLRDGDYRLPEHDDRSDEHEWQVLVGAYHVVKK